MIAKPKTGKAVAMATKKAAKPVAAPTPTVPTVEDRKRAREMRDRLLGKADDEVDISDIDDRRTARKLAYLADRSREISTAIKELEDEKKSTNADIVAIMETLDVTKVRGPGFLVLPAKGTSKTIVAEKLLERGVSVEDIEYATVEKSWSTYQVRGVKS